MIVPFPPAPERKSRAALSSSTHSSLSDKRSLNPSNRWNARWNAASALARKLHLLGRTHPFAVAVVERLVDNLLNELRS